MIDNEKLKRKFVKRYKRECLKYYILSKIIPIKRLRLKYHVLSKMALLRADRIADQPWFC